MYLNFPNVYGHQNWQNGNFPWWAPVHKATWPFDHVVMWSRDDLKSLYLHYCSACSHTTWKASHLSWATSTHNVTPLPGHVVLWDYGTNYNHYISFIKISMATKLGRMVTILTAIYLLPFFKWSYDGVVFWHHVTN